MAETRSRPRAAPAGESRNSGCYFFLLLVASEITPVPRRRIRDEGSGVVYENVYTCPTPDPRFAVPEELKFTDSVSAVNDRMGPTGGANPVSDTRAREVKFGMLVRSVMANPLNPEDCVQPAVPLFTTRTPSPMLMLLRPASKVVTVPGTATVACSKTVLAEGKYQVTFTVSPTIVPAYAGAAIPIAKHIKSKPRNFFMCVRSFQD
jgi:hypothetical protein